MIKTKFPNELQSLPYVSSESIPVKLPNPGVLIYGIETLCNGDISNSLIVCQSSNMIKASKSCDIPIICIRNSTTTSTTTGGSGGISNIINPLAVTADLRIDDFDEILNGIEILKDSSTY